MRRAVAPHAPRVHVLDALAPGATISLPAAAAHHLARVLRDGLYVSLGLAVFAVAGLVLFDMQASALRCFLSRFEIECAAGHLIDMLQEAGCSADGSASAHSARALSPDALPGKG